MGWYENNNEKQGEVNTSKLIIRHKNKYGLATCLHSQSCRGFYYTEEPQIHFGEK